MVKIHGIPRVLQRSQRIRVKVPSEFAYKYSSETLKYLKILSPYRTKSPDSAIKQHLKQSWNRHVSGKKIYITNTAPHAEFYVYGTRTPIRPRSKKVLKFYSLGTTWYKPQVSGQAPKDILVRSLELAAQSAKINLKKIMFEVI